MSATRLYLVRHGETDWNAEGRIQGQKDSQLNERGRAQAREKSDQIIALNAHAVYCSTSVRTRQTVHDLLVGKVEGVEYQDNLREICVGAWEGKLRDEIEKRDPQQYAWYWEQPELFELEGAETFAQLQHRGVSALTAIAQAHVGQRVLVVSHGAIIKASLLHWLGLPMSQMWREPLVGNCSVSELEFSAQGKVAVLSVADERL